MRTHVRLLTSSVRTHVRLEVCPLVGAVRTHLTHKRLLASVGTHMVNNISFN